MRRGSAVAVTLVLSAVCAGCGNWSGFGFHADGREMPRLKSEVTLKTGMVVADVGAGKGALTFALAREVGSNGHVFSTEIDRGRLRRLREAVVTAKLDNVTVVEASVSETGLPPNCCDAIVLRRVYHHLTDSSGANASLFARCGQGACSPSSTSRRPSSLAEARSGFPRRPSLVK